MSRELVAISKCTFTWACVGVIPGEMGVIGAWCYRSSAAVLGERSKAGPKSGQPCAAVKRGQWRADLMCLQVTLVEHLRIWGSETWHTESSHEILDGIPG